MTVGYSMKGQNRSHFPPMSGSEQTLRLRDIKKQHTETLGGRISADNRIKKNIKESILTPTYSKPNPKAILKPSPKVIPKVSSPPVRMINTSSQKLFSDEAQLVFQQNKYLFFGQQGCPHCSKEKNIIDGKFRSAKLVGSKNDLKIDYSDWDESEKTYKSNLQVLKELEEKQQRKEISKIQYYKLKNELDHVIKMNQIMIDPKLNFKQLKSKIDFRYYDPKDEKLRNSVLQFHEKLKCDPKSRKEAYKQLRNSKDPIAKDILQYLISNEIMDAYGINSFPTVLLTKCEVEPKKMEELKKSGKTDGILSKCKKSGYMEPLGLLEFDADQRGDNKKLKVIAEFHKQKSITEYADITEILPELKGINLKE